MRNIELFIIKTLLLWLTVLVLALVLVEDAEAELNKKRATTSPAEALGSDLMARGIPWP